MVMKKLFILMAIAITSLSASAQKNNQTDTLQVRTTPQMHCVNCENKIKKNIRFVKGVKEIKTSVPDQKVIIIYQKDKSTYEDFVKAFSKIGYKIDRYAYECSPDKK